MRHKRKWRTGGRPKCAAKPVSRGKQKQRLKEQARAWGSWRGGKTAVTQAADYQPSVLVETADLSRDEWLAYRRKRHRRQRRISRFWVFPPSARPETSILTKNNIAQGTRG